MNDEPPCGAITLAPWTREGRQRCLREITHRGPHWTDVETIDCDHEYFCPGHTKRTRTEERP